MSWRGLTGEFPFFDSEVRLRQKSIKKPPLSWAYEDGFCNKLLPVLTRSLTWLYNGCGGKGAVNFHEARVETGLKSDLQHFSS